MNNLIEFLTSKEIIIVYIASFIACLVSLIIFFIRNNLDKFKRRQNTKELNKLVEQVNEKIEKENKQSNKTTVTAKISKTKEKSALTEMIENTKKEEIKGKQEEVEEPIIVSSSQINVSKKEEKEELEYTTIEPDQQTAKLELEKLKIALKKQEEEELLRIQEEKLKEQRRLEELRKEEERLAKEKQEKERVAEKVKIEEDNNIKLTNYEEEQEENAIISLQELVTKGKDLYEANELTQYLDEGNEPISIQDLEKQMDKKATEVNDEFVISNIIKEEDLTKDVDDIDIATDYIPIQEIRKKNEELEKQEVVERKRVTGFRSSPIISPIYGIEKNNLSENNDIELENTANYDKLDHEIKKTNEFLMTLKELQKNLE